MRRAWLAGAAATAAGYVWARHVEPFRPRIEHIDIPVPPALNRHAGLRIAFLTDFHVGPYFGPANAERAIDLAVREQPDVVLLGGDYVSDSVRYIRPLHPMFNWLSESSKFGSIAVLGNHDLSLSRRKISDVLESANVQVLNNSAVAVAGLKPPLWVVGVDDTLLGDPDLDMAFADVPSECPTIMLWHEPAFADQSANRGSFLQLSGHSHGGQIGLPFLPPVWVPPHGKPYPVGLSYANGMPIYTSRGIGVYRPPVRINCPPEVTIITLR